MSELSIVVPLSALPEDTPMTAEGIMRTIGDAQTAREAAEHYKEMYNALVGTVQSAGNSLTLILDEVDDEYEKVRALRSFAAEMKELGTSVRKMP